jgi:Na+-translocating ferredoxin:NAD+ oxidoreductase subunit D
MSSTPATQSAETCVLPPSASGPFLHAAEGARTVFVVTMIAACGPLVAGWVLFGFRAAIVSALAIGSCVLIERLYYRVTKLPSLLGRSHAFLTGVLLALTLPPFVPWYVPVTAAAFAIIVGKAVFGGVGHFLWQPALVGRLAVAAVFASPAIGADLNPEYWPILAQNRLLVGDVRSANRVEDFRQWQWRGTPAPQGKDGFLLPTPRKTLAGITDWRDPGYSAIAYPSEEAVAQKPVLNLRLPPINDLIYGAYPGGIGETCAAIIVMAGLYLIYRNYVRWQVPVFFIMSAVVTAAVAPVFLAGPHDTVLTVWLPLLSEGADMGEKLGVGMVYVSYQVLGGELLLAAFFLAPEMTSRPVTRGGAMIFGIGCGVAAMLLRMYTSLPIPAYLAVLAMNTLTPLIDACWRPRVLGARRWRKN